jgi:UDP-3-O-acyl N-acetylglucosamine deacetylase
MRELGTEMTVAGAVALSGRALISGEIVDITIHPDDAGRGISFLRSDMGDGLTIKADIKNIYEGNGLIKCTTLGGSDPLVFPVEHILAALVGVGVTNAIIVLDGPEIPFFDGSATEYARAIDSVGLVKQQGERKIIKIHKSIEVADGNRRIRMLPHDSYSISYKLAGDHPGVREQKFEFDTCGDAFLDEVAGARTFCTEGEARALVDSGVGGADYSSGLVIGENGPIENEFRYPNELARHKLLDIMGDLALVGCDIEGRIEAVHSGHDLNIRLAQKVLGGLD